MRTLCISGWGQPHDALISIAPDATHFEYAHHNSPEEAIAALIEAAQSYERIIGWSLGGQLAVRAISQGLIKPKKLVLIGVPFQFVRDKKLNLGMPRDTYDIFCANYAENPERTLKKSWNLIAYGDVREVQVKAYLTTLGRKKMLEKNWHRWLEYLNGFSCADLNFAHFPPTLLIHGDKDAVVWHEQSQHFVKHLPHSTLETFIGCGHAPHWHDAKKVSELIAKHV